MMFTRIGIGRRPHLIGANVSDLTLNQLQSIHGSINITLQGWTYSGQINLSGVNGFKEAAADIQTALDTTLPTAAATTGDSITPETVSFTGTINHASLQVTSISSGTLRIGAQISGPGIKPKSEVERHFASVRKAWRRWNLHSLFKLRDCFIGTDDSVVWIADRRRGDVWRGRNPRSR